MALEYYSLCRQIRRLQQGGLPVSPELNRFVTVALNWRLPAPAYAGHLVLCCLDFPDLVLRPRPIISLPKAGKL